MKIIKYSAALILGMFAQKYTFAAGVCAAATAAACASSIGSDPVPWALAAFGAAIAYVKNPPTSRLDAIANAGISVILGGIGAPVAAALAGKYVAPELQNSWLMAFAIAVAWPRAVALGWTFLSKRAEK